jgi:TRAP-type mannitol/chloroaromatic compound transport system permease large subunit
MEHLLDLLMFATLCAAILTGFPVVFILTGCSVLFGGLGILMGVFDARLFGALPQRIYGLMTSEILVAIPLFVFMGIMLERSKIAEELLSAMGRLFGKLRGGLAISVTVVGALLAASTGIVGATVVTMGLMALPTMLRIGYARSLACGTVCAAGTLGQIIPPSTTMVILGEVLSAAYQQAQLAQGVFAVQTVSVGQLFAGSMLPGVLLVGLYMSWQLTIAFLRPEMAPPVHDEAFAGGRPRVRELARALLPPLILMVAVLGSILGGIATPSEAAGVGAVGATLLAGERLVPGRGWPIWQAGFCVLALLVLSANFDLRLGRPAPPMGDRLALWAAGLLTLGLAFGILTALWRCRRTGVLEGVMRSTLTITSMIFATLIGATLFALVFRGLGGDAMIEHWLEQLPGGVHGALVVVMIFVFLMGFFLDYVEITIIVIPIVGPVLLGMGLDPVWFGVLFAVTVQTTFLTPPFGFSLFYLRGVAPPEVRTVDIYKGVIPFVALQLLAVGIIILAPGLATWLPRVLFG